MRLLANTHIPFMRYRRIWVTVSVVLVVLSLYAVFLGPGLNFGVDFAGGTQLTLKFRTEPDQARLRRALEDLRLGEVLIQRFDEVDRHEFLVRVQNPAAEGDFTAQMLEALDREFNPAVGALRLNLQGVDAVRDALVDADPDRIGGTVESRRAVYQPMAEGVLALRRQLGVLEDRDLDRAAELSATTRQFLAAEGRFGEFALLAADNVGPLVGRDLRQKATLAVVFSLLGMLAYIAVRFKLPYGIGAVASLFHDVIVCLGVLSLTGREINLPTIAALLTLVGYSVNDSVVIFDRIRERLRLDRGKPLPDLMDLALNQTLSRTIITSGLTELVVVSLFIFGGDVINTFAFILLIGIILGTYSSIYVASPVALVISTLVQRRKMQRRQVTAPSQRKR